jgi:frataxin-like iron-binding protein CyaY
MGTSVAGYVNKKLLIPIFLLFLTGMAFAIDVNFTPPRFKSNNPEYQDLINDLNDEIASEFEEYENQIKSEMRGLPDSFPNLAKAFANTSVFSSDGASQRAYKGYNVFSFTVGFMSSLQFPRKFTLLDEIKDAINSGEGEIDFDFGRDNMDIDLGLDVQILNAQFGINTSKFLLDGLYLGFKFSMFDTNWIKYMPLSGFSFRTMSVGTNASYQLIKQKRLPGGLLVWRGLNLGTGFIWQNTSLGLTTPLITDEDLLYVSIPIDTIGTISMQLDEVFHLGINTNTYIIPIEAMTSIRLLWFLNLALGAGVDVALGGSNIEAYGSIDVKNISGLEGTGITIAREPSLDYSMGGKSAPSIFNLKAMGAVGFNFGPVIIDIPVTYYFLNNGYSLGVTFGFTF